jgi:hypothetical protein
MQSEALKTGAGKEGAAETGWSAEALALVPPQLAGARRGLPQGLQGG